MPTSPMREIERKAPFTDTPEMKHSHSERSLWSQCLLERGSVFVEATFVVPAFVFLMLGCIQLMVIGWKLSEVQLNTAAMARTAGVAAALNSDTDPCSQQSIDNDAETRGNKIFGQGTFTKTVTRAGNTACVPEQALVLTVTYKVPLFFGALVPGGIDYTYRGQAIVFPERSSVE